MHLKPIFSLLLFLFFFVQLFAQEPEKTVKKRGGAIQQNKDAPLLNVPSKVDSNVVNFAALDTAIVLKDTLALEKKTKRPIRDFIRKDYPNPRKAALFSIIPGGGQIYNKSYWKLPLLYGGIVGMTILMKRNNKFYVLYRDNYKDVANGLPPRDMRLVGVSATSLKSARDAARKNLELSGLIFGLGYLLFTAEAFVDAHLGTFDVSDDLSFKIKPIFAPNQSGTNSTGLGLAFNFH
jgi:hypothetical protein